MRILSLDPGVKTGVIIMEDEKVIFHDTYEFVNDPQLREYLQRVLSPLPDCLLVERLPEVKQIHIGAKIIESICLAVGASFDVQRFRISPGEWKPLAAKVKVPRTFHLCSDHERDAYRMARYYRFKAYGAPLTS